MNRLITLFGMLFLLAPEAMAARQQDGLCSRVAIQIQQELALERIGFLATLEVTNNEPDAAITDFSAALTFELSTPETDGTYADASDLFFIQQPILAGIDTIDGTGLIPPGQTAIVQWFIIPVPTTGGTTPAGIQYRVGAELGGSLYGEVLPPESWPILPDTITVKPDPLLDITYFQPRDVDGDDPFTLDIVEPPVPFTLGVLVRNIGYGPARSLTISSEQPRIVEDEQGLLVVPQLLGSRVDDEPTDYASLVVDLGTIQPSQCRKGAWDMITTLSGEFVEFSASYTHSPELGGRDTSVIDSLNAYFLSHEVRNDQPGRDDLTDFLAQINPPQAIDGLPDVPGEIIPDTLFETDCNVIPVNTLVNVAAGPLSGNSATITATADVENWVTIIVPDPAQAYLPIRQVTRSDGKILDAANAWTHVRYSSPGNQRNPFLLLFDFVDLGVSYTYTVEYEPALNDVTPPVTSVIFSGPHERAGDTVYLLPETTILFLVDDESPSGTVRRVDADGDFVPAYPFEITEPGPHGLEFFSTDAAGNIEPTQAITVVVAPDYPAITGMQIDSSELYLTGDAISIRPEDAAVSFDVLASGLTQDAVIEVYQGALAAPQLLGVPSSPTAASDALLTVLGDRVDRYSYRINAGAWSVPADVSTPLSLSGLTGAVELEVKGWSQYGDEPADEDALSVSWTVSGSAAVTEVRADQPFPSREQAASFTVSGPEYYRWRTPGSYYRADTDVSLPFSLPRMPPGDTSVEVRGGAAGAWLQDEESPTTLKHSWAPEWGVDFPAALRVRTDPLGAAAGGTSWAWDGRDDLGNPVPPGWYTVKLSITDGLGRTRSEAVLVRVGDLLANTTPLDASTAAQDLASAEAGWVVWQDQRTGTWDIWAAPTDGSSPPASLTSGTRNHERPHTDGFFAVWQERTTAGTWEVRARPLGSPDADFAVAPDPTLDQTRPTVFWPWVVWQERSAADPGAPWQLVAHDLARGTTAAVDPSSSWDQLDPHVHGDQVVWQDMRDVGFGDIYLADLFTGEVTRISNDAGGSYYPRIQAPWVVWADNRDGDFDVYAHDLRSGGERAVTDSVSNETRPSLSGSWVVFTDDATGGVSEKNLAAVHLPTGGTVALTNAVSDKSRAFLTDGFVLWTELTDGIPSVQLGKLPDLQAVTDNRNLVALTPGVVSRVGTAHALLEQWHAAAGVTEITRYTQLMPPVAETVTWAGTSASGPDFALQDGGFIWVSFPGSAVVDFDRSDCSPRDLGAGASVLGYPCFPDDYTAFRLASSLGLDKVTGLRALDRATGTWSIASVRDGRLVGEDFHIDTVSVVLLDLTTGVTAWRP